MTSFFNSIVQQLMFSIPDISHGKLSIVDDSYIINFKHKNINIIKNNYYVCIEHNNITIYSPYQFIYINKLIKLFLYNNICYSQNNITNKNIVVSDNEYSIILDDNIIYKHTLNNQEHKFFDKYIIFKNSIISPDYRILYYKGVYGYVIKYDDINCRLFLIVSNNIIYKFITISRYIFQDYQYYIKIYQYNNIIKIKYKIIHYNNVNSYKIKLTKYHNKYIGYISDDIKLYVSNIGSTIEYVNNYLQYHIAYI